MGEGQGKWESVISVLTAQRTELRDSYEVIASRIDECLEFSSDLLGNIVII